MFDETKLEKILRLLQQPSTWVGISGLTALGAVFGFDFTEEHQKMIIGVAGALIFLIHMFKDEDKVKTFDPGALSKLQLKQLIAKGIQAGVLKPKKPNAK